MMELNKIYLGDSLTTLKTFPDGFVNCCISSPPYWGLRDYGTANWEGGDTKCDHKGKPFATANKLHEGQPKNELHKEFFKEICGKCGAKRIDEQIGLESTPDEYVSKLVELFREVRRVLKDDGVLWLNLGDSYYNFRGYTDYATKQSCSSNEAHVMNTPCGKRNVIQEGLKGKDLVGIPWMVAFALRADGWYLRQDIIWHKPNPMPESVTDRCTKSHEYIFLMSKSSQYYFNNEAIKEKAIYGMNGEDKRPSGVVRDREYDYDSKQKAMGRHKNLQEKGQSNHTMHVKRDKRAGEGRIAYGGKRNGEEGQGQESFVSIPEYRNKRDVWTISTKPYSGAHFATFPEDLILPMVLAGCPAGGVILDPFMGAGTTALVAKKNGCSYVGCELNPAYIEIAEKRIAQEYLF